MKENFQPNFNGGVKAEGGFIIYVSCLPSIPAVVRSVPTGSAVYRGGFTTQLAYLVSTVYSEIKTILVSVEQPDVRPGVASANQWVASNCRDN